MIDGKTDKCSRSEDINFQFTGFGVVGQVSELWFEHILYLSLRKKFDTVFFKIFQNY